MAVRLLDLPAQHAGIQDSLEEAVLRVLRSGRYVLGEEVRLFEEELAASIGVSHAIGVSSGTDALLLVLMGLDISPGDEVVTSPFTFFASAGVVARLGARPVFVDIEADTFNMDLGQIESVLTERTRAIVPVHLFGQVVDVAELRRIATEGDLAVVEDACQAIGGERQGEAAGAIGRAGCFSFFPTKNLGAVGDAGAVTTDDPEFAKSLRELRVHGQGSQYRHHRVGGNFRIDEMQAAVLRVKLQRLSDWEDARRDCAERYGELFAASGLVGDEVELPVEKSDARHVYHQYVLRVRDRDRLREALSAAAIDSGVYYPVPLHLQDCFRHLGYRKGDFPVAERAAGEVLALPIHPEVTLAQQQEVVETIREFYRGDTG